MLIFKRCYIVDESKKTRLLIEMVQNSSTVSSFQLSEFSEKKEKPLKMKKTIGNNLDSSLEIRYVIKLFLVYIPSFSSLVQIHGQSCWCINFLENNNIFPRGETSFMQSLCNKQLDYKFYWIHFCFIVNIICLNGKNRLQEVLCFRRFSQWRKMC